MSMQTSRRQFLRLITLAGGTLAVAALSACGAETPPATVTATAEATPNDAAANVLTAATCNGFDSLTARDRQTRITLNYVDISPDPQRPCELCQFYTEPIEATAPCGGCQILRGPIAPQGYCTTWVLRAG